MKISRSRQHVIAPKQYESITLRAWIEVDDANDELPSEFSTWHDYMDKFLDDALDSDLARAVESAPKSHLEDFYE